MKDINLFNGIKKSAAPKKSSKSIAAGLVMLIVCAVAVGGLYFWQTRQKNDLDSKIEAANQQIGTSQSTNSTEMTGKQSELAAIRTYNAMLAALDENVQAYPELSAEFFADLERRMPSGVTVQTLGYQSGVLSLDGTADNADGPSNFADALAGSVYIETAELTGSQLDVQMELDTGTVQYGFNIQCYLKGGEGQ